MPESFGARLRQQREARHVDLLAIASQTRIKLALLEALERDDVSHWPAGIFRRAYLRTYAEFIGLDPDVALREFLEVHPDPESVADALAAAAEAARRNGPPPTRLRTIVDSAIGFLNECRVAGHQETALVVRDSLRRQRLSGGLQVVAHEVQPLSRRTVGRVHGQFRRRQLED